uniref:NF-kappa-B essential modulator n=1 Tax=Geotrypetes seraphini TaxID=260995 RepID=A0A6P8PKK8_GEOSA|nr:NF-kappa-B essential modulator isoform X2 [Geotrypetes seraphini]
MNVNQKNQTCAMVQPSGSSGSDFDNIGGASSLGKSAMLQLPSDLANHEVIQRLMVENQDLREAIRQSNHMLRERYKEFIHFQASQREEKEFLMHKFTEARQVVEKLNSEKAQLKKQLEESAAELEQLKNDQEVAAIKGEVGEAESETKGVADVIVDNSSPGSSLSSYNTITQSMFETMKLQVASLDSTAPKTSEAGTEFLQLLKERKEQLEEDLKKFRESNEKLLQEKQDLLTLNQELQARVASAVQIEEHQQNCQENGAPVERLLEKEALQGAGDSSRKVDTEERELNKKLKESEDRNLDLKMQLESAQGEVVQLKKRERELEWKAQQQLHVSQQKLEQLEEEKASVKAQVTSLLAELTESQCQLEICKREKQDLKDRHRITSDTLQQRKGESEMQLKKHSVQVDQLRLQVQNLEAALKVERQNGSEEKRKLAQLQAAYHQLFQEYDLHIKSSMDTETRNRELSIHLEDLSQQLNQAEEALGAKQGLIDKLKEEAEKHKTTQEAVAVLKAQAEIYKLDFMAERRAREQLHEQRERLQEQLDQLQKVYEKLKSDSEGTSRTLSQLMNRHSDNFRTALPQPGVPYPLNPGPFPLQHSIGHRRSISEDQPALYCPKCQFKAPDMDTLQIHVMDCIE